jgi:hypothetical protein
MLRLLDVLENELKGCISTGFLRLLQGNKLGGPLPELIVLCSSPEMNGLRAHLMGWSKLHVSSGFPDVGRPSTSFAIYLPDGGKKATLNSIQQMIGTL